MKLPPWLQRVIEATALGLTIGGALKVWEHRDRLDKLDEDLTLLASQVDAIERLPVIDTALSEAQTRRWERERRAKDSAIPVDKPPA